jgi:cell wall-associated NlpC family hydrolase
LFTDRVLKRRAVRSISPVVSGVMANGWRSTKTFVRRVLIAGVLLAVVALGAAAAAIAWPGHAASQAATPAVPAADSAPLPPSHPQVVQPEAGVAADDQPAPTTSNGSGAPNDDEIKRELAQLKSLAANADLPVGAKGRVLGDGRAVAPRQAPQIVRDVINAGNVIAKTPYLWGGGHGSWASVGYDCSGSVSFALAGAGLLDSPLTSGLLAKWGAPGPGRWVTIYANAGHVFMVVAGLRFDTGGLSGDGTRWQPTGRSTAGFVARHPEGL